MSQFPIGQRFSIKRVTFYSGKLFFGDQVFDGSEDVTVEVYKGEANE